MNEILKYYKSKDFKPVLPKNPERRLFKGINKDGHWRTNKRTIRTVKHLKNFIIKDELIDVYYTRNEFLNPRRLQKKTSITDKKVVRQNIIVDIDEDFSIKGLEKARISALKCIELLQIPLTKIVFTGSKGFRLEFKGQINGLREKQNIYKLRKQYNISIDRGVLDDEFVIIRLINSVNSKSTLLCKELTLNQLNQPIEAILGLVNLFNVHISEMPPALETGNKADERGDVKILSPPLPNPVNEGTDITSSQITNRTGRRYVVIIKHTLERKRMLRKVQQRYDLGTLYGFKQGDYYYWVSPRTFQKGRLRKVLKASQSLNLKEFDRFGKNFFIMLPEPLYIGKLECPTKATMSQEHIKILSMFDKVDFDKVHKEKKLEIITGVKYEKKNQGVPNS